MGDLALQTKLGEADQRAMPKKVIVLVLPIMYAAPEQPFTATA